MSTNVSLNGVTYAIPATGESAWGAAVTAFLVALGSGVLQKAGGAFTLTADADFGANFGLKSAYYKSRGTVAAAGQVRLGAGESIRWRNAGNTDDLSLSTATDWLQFAGVDLANLSRTQTLSNKTLASALLTGSLDVASAGNFAIGASVGANNLTLGGGTSTVVIPGNLQVDGTTTSVNSTNLEVADKNINVNNGGNDASSEGAGLTIERTGTAGSFIYKDASATKFALGAAGSEVDVVGISSTQTLTNKTLTTPTIATPVIDDYLDINEEAAPGTPAANKVRIYAKSDAKIYKKDDAGVETQLATTAEALANPMDDVGQLIYGGALGAATKLAAGKLGQGVRSGGAGAPTWAWQRTASAVSSADYTVTDTDGFTTLLVTTGGSNRTMTLPTAADNTGRRLIIKKVDSGTGNVIVDGENSETIDGALTLTLMGRYDAATLTCDGTGWNVESRATIKGDWVPVAGGGSGYGAGTIIARYVKTGARCTLNWTNVDFDTDGTDTITMTLPFPAKSTLTYYIIVTNNGTVQNGRLLTTAGSVTCNPCAAVASTAFTGTTNNNSFNVQITYEVDE